MHTTSSSSRVFATRTPLLDRAITLATVLACLLVAGADHGSGAEKIPFKLHRVGDDRELTGKAVTRAVNLADLTIPDAADLAAERLRRVGVYTALEAAGAIPGDVVRIGQLEFEYLPDVPWEDDDDWFEDEEE